jgi:hypothetical protein
MLSVKIIQCGVEQWQLVGLITRRSQVRILSPLPDQQKGTQNGAFLLLDCEIDEEPVLVSVVLHGSCELNLAGLEPNQTFNPRNRPGQQ